MLDRILEQQELWPQAEEGGAGTGGTYGRRVGRVPELRLCSVPACLQKGSQLTLRSHSIYCLEFLSLTGRGPLQRLHATAILFKHSQHRDLAPSVIFILPCLLPLSPPSMGQMNQGQARHSGLPSLPLEEASTFSF